MGTFIQNVSAIPTLTCVATSTPPVSNVTIFQNGKELANATGNIVMYTFPTALELIDSGSQFECMAVNEAGVQSSRSFELIVQGEPVEGAWEGIGRGRKGGGEKEDALKWVADVGRLTRLQLYQTYRGWG